MLVDRHDRYYEEEDDWADKYMASDGTEASIDQEEEHALPELQVGELFAMQGAESVPDTAGRAMLSINEGMCVCMQRQCWLNLNLVLPRI